MQYAFLALIILGMVYGIRQVVLRNKKQEPIRNLVEELPVRFQLPVQIKYWIGPAGYWSMKTASGNELIVREGAIEISMRGPLKYDRLGKARLFDPTNTEFEYTRIRSGEWIAISGLEPGDSGRVEQVAVRNRRHNREILDALATSGARRRP